MTTTPVMSITDEQIAEIEAAAEINAYVTNPWIFEELATASTVAAIISRLRAAEKDARRYQWLIQSAWYVGPEPQGDTEAVSWHDHNETAHGVTAAIDAAMEQSK